MIDQVDFLEKHKRIREASDTVLFMGLPRSYGKSFFKGLVFRMPVIHISSDIQIFFDDLEKACRKKQYKKTKSKQPRYVYVVKRSEV